MPAGRVSTHPWAHYDLFPTLAELARRRCRSRTGRPVDGAPRFAARPRPSHDFLYWEFHERGFQQAVRMGQWKAVRLKAGAPLELYDLAADPAEQRDVAASRPEIVARIENYLRTARTESERWPVK